MFMGHHIMKWAKLNLVARHYDPYVPEHKGHNCVQKNSTWPISLRGDLYIADHSLTNRHPIDTSLYPISDPCPCSFAKIFARFARKYDLLL